MMPVKQIIVILAVTLLVYNTSPVIGQSPEGNFNSGINYFNSGQYSKALPYFQSCLTTLPAGSGLLEQAHFYLIKSYVKLEDETQTLTELDNLRTRNPQSPAWDDLNYLIGIWYYEKQRYTEAGNYLDDLVTNYPESPYRAKALLYQMWLGYWSNSETAIEKAYSEMVEDYSDRPEMATALCEKGQFELRKVNYTQAVSYYNEVLTQYPQYRWAVAEAHNGLGTIYLHQENYTDALAQFEMIESMNINSKWNALAEDYMGYTYRLMGDYVNARLKYHHILATYSDLPEMQAGAQYKIGCCYYDQKQLENALANFQSVLSQYPTSSWVEPAKSKIQLIQKSLGRKP